MLLVFAACGETGPQGSSAASQNAESQASYVFTPQATWPWAYFLKDGTVAAVNNMDLFFVNGDNEVVRTVPLTIAPSQLAFNDSDGTVLTQRGMRGNIQTARVNGNWRLFDFTVWNAEGEELYITPTMPINAEQGTEETVTACFAGDSKVVFMSVRRLFLLDYKTQEFKLLYDLDAQTTYASVSEVFQKDGGGFYFTLVDKNDRYSFWESDYEGNKKLLYEGGWLTYTNGNFIFIKTYTNLGIVDQKTDVFILDKASGTVKLLFTSERGIMSVGVDDPDSGLISFTILVPDSFKPTRANENFVAVDLASGEVLAQTSERGTLMGAKKVDGQIFIFHIPPNSHDLKAKNCATGEVILIQRSDATFYSSFSPDYERYIIYREDENGVWRLQVKKVEL